MLSIMIGLFISAAHATCDFPVPAYKIHEATMSGVDKYAFNQALNKIESVYKPIFEKRGCPLQLVRSWSDGTVNAQAWQEDGKCFVEMFGGLARYPGMTAGALQVVACHEIGHHLGGRPYYSGETLSVEGQADYFSTLECMKMIGVLSTKPSLTLARTLADLSGEQMPSRLTPSKEIVWRTMQGHPPAQCRLDTLDHGRLVLSRPRCWFYKE